MKTLSEPCSTPLREGTTDMADILFVTWDGGGNLPPAIGIGRELRSRGHEVRFIGHAGVATR